MDHRENPLHDADWHQQPQQQQRSAEWCQHEPPVLIHDKQGIPVISAITWGGYASQDALNALGAVNGHINGDGDLVIAVPAPDFPWGFTIVTKIGRKNGSPRYHSRLIYGNQDAALKPGEGYRVVVALPDLSKEPR